MEKLTLTPKASEIIVNNGSTDGAVDLFSYGLEMEPAARTLGSLYVLGWRQADTNTMGYMVSLIAALARREYYANPSQAPKEAFARTLRKINEVVDEFFKSAGIDLAVGIFAVAGGSIMVSKLDKFKVLLAREGQVIDILNNIALFNKEHLEKRRFSSIISGSVQVGDRLLAYYPAKNVVARERSFKAWLLADEGPALAARLTQLGQEQPAFGASFMQIDLIEVAQPTVEPESPPVDTPQDAPTPPDMAAGQSGASLAWSPRQHAPATSAAPAQPAGRTLDPEQEVPHIIATEFSLGTRQSSFGRWFGRAQLVRLDTRGKAIVLTTAALLIAGGVLAAKSFLFVNALDEKNRETVSLLTTQFSQARELVADQPAQARSALTRLLATLNADTGLQEDKPARQLAAAIGTAIDGLDNAQPAQASVLAQLDPKTDLIELAVWSSSSNALWAVTAADGARSVIRLAADGTVAGRTMLTDAAPTLLVGHKNGVLAVDTEKRTVSRIADGTVSAYVVPTTESILDATMYADTLYLLTDKSILKISDLDTRKAVTKQWLTDQTELATGAYRIFVDGNVYTMGRDGAFTTYYKGERTSTVKTPLEPAGAWRLVPLPDSTHLGIANAATLRVYTFAIADGSLVDTIKLDTQQPLVLMNEGPGLSVIAVTEDNRIWKLE